VVARAGSATHLPGSSQLSSMLRPGAESAVTLV
jgi:hypothetical protein